MLIKKLNWEELNGHFGKSWIASFGFNSSYLTYLCKHSGKPTAIDLFKKKHEFETINSAKEWCQTDFERKILTLFEPTI